MADQATIAGILADPNVSAWMKSALRAALQCDAACAAHEAWLLADVLCARAESKVFGDPSGSAKPVTGR